MAGLRRRDAVALSGALVLVVVSVWIVRQIRTSDNPVNTATVYGAYLGLATLLVSLLAFLGRWWWKGRRVTAVPASTVQITAAADQFAQRMPTSGVTKRRSAGSARLRRSGSGGSGARPR